MQPVVETETIPLQDATGRVLAQDLFAARANPPSANSAVDGYGFAWPADGVPQSLPLHPGRAAAGVPFDGTVPSGSAVRILTGASIPNGVDTVALEEEVTLTDGRIQFDRAPKRGANVRQAGEDVPEGGLVLQSGRQLAPPDLALLAATGCHRIPVKAPLRVGILSTGDEVAEIGSATTATGIFDANRPMLRAVLARWGMEPVDLGIAPDNKGKIRACLTEGARMCDAILTSGGASAGDEDHVSAILQDENDVIAWRVAVKPGRPFAAGRINGTPVFALPGNPVAALVCTLVFARPALLALAGAGWAKPTAVELPAAFTKSKRAGRVEFLRARPGPDGRVEVFSSEGSGRISGLSWAEGLVELRHGAIDIAPGTPVRYLPFASFGL